MLFNRVITILVLVDENVWWRQQLQRNYERLISRIHPHTILPKLFSVNLITKPQLDEIECKATPRAQNAALFSCIWAGNLDVYHKFIEILGEFYPEFQQSFRSSQIVNARRIESKTGPINRRSDISKQSILDTSVHTSAQTVFREENVYKVRSWKSEPLLA